MTAVRSVLTRGGFLELKQGAYASLGGKACKIRRVLSMDSVVIQYVDTGETERTHPTELRPVEDVRENIDPNPEQEGEGKPDPRTNNDASTRDIRDISDIDWAEAKRLFEIIKPLLEMPDRTRADVETVAKTQGVRTGTVYEWMANYRSSGHISGLVKGKRGRKRGTKLLTPEQEAVIDEVLEGDFLSSQSYTPAAVIDLIQTACDEKHVKRPHANTVRNRIADIPLKRRLSSRGNSEKAKQLSEPRPGSFPDGSVPLECVQIDHVLLDIKAVDAETRQPIETRPWLTLAIDAYSRMIVGYFLSFARPSAFAAGVCLYMAMMRKSDLLTALGLPGRWPVFGKMRKVLADNAKEFKGATLQRACEEHGIDIQLRPVKTPHYGAYIEAMVGNVNKQLHKRRGTTHRSPSISPDYDSSGEAVYTLAEIECDVVDWIVNSYHVDAHSSLNTTPLHKWEKGLLGDKNRPGIGLPPIPADPEKLRLDFLPFEMRAIHPYGVEIDRRMYYHEVLSTWVGAADQDHPKKKRKFIFAYDPRTIRHVWFWDPQLKQYFQIPVRDTTWPDIGWSEFNEYYQAMRKEGHEQIDEAAIRGYVARSKAREQVAVEKTQSAKAGKSKSAAPGATKKRSNMAPGSGIYAATQPPSHSTEAVSDDLFSQPVKAFDDIDL